MFLEYLQPSVELFNVRIDEPVTTATDLVLASVCLVAFFGTGRRTSGGILSLPFRFFFFCLGTGALTGGILGHALLYLLDPHWKLVSWLLINLSVAFLVQAVAMLAEPLLGTGRVRWITVINLGAMAVACFFTIRDLQFDPVAYYSAFGIFLLSGSMILFLVVRTGNRHLFKLMVAVLLATVSGIVFSLKWGLGPWFNHMDLCHVLLSISVWFIFRGSKAILKGDPFVSS